MLMELFPMPLLAQDLGSIIFILFLLFSFFGFISNLIKGNAGNQPQGRRRPQRRGGELQNEIDDFLKEVLGDEPAKGRQRRQPQQRAPVEFGDDDLEVIGEESDYERRQREERRRQERERQERQRRERQREIRQKQERERRERERRQQEQRRREQRKREQQQRDEVTAPIFDEETAKPSKSLKDRHIESSVESHVETYMTHSVADQRLEQGTVAPIVGEALPGGDVSGEETPSPVARELLALLKSPAGIRQVILANEVLGKPKGLRSGSD